jgi:arylsulfatase A-like enzyme
LITTLVTDLADHGLLDDTLVIAMGEFGRTPTLGTQGSKDGRNHWPHVMSMCMAGGGFRHGQVIGASSHDGGEISERPVTPGDLAATIYHHMGVPLDATYTDHQGRPLSIVENGSPLSELI